MVAAVVIAGIAVVGLFFFGFGAVGGTDSIKIIPNQDNGCEANGAQWLLARAAACTAHSMADSHRARLVVATAEAIAADVVAAALAYAATIAAAIPIYGWIASAALWIAAGLAALASAILWGEVTRLSLDQINLDQTADLADKTVADALSKIRSSCPPEKIQSLLSTPPPC